MLHRRIWSALVGVLAAGVLVTACGGGDDVEVVQPGPGTGEQGQSCGSNSDCVSGLVCVSNVCASRPGTSPAFNSARLARAVSRGPTVNRAFSASPTSVRTGLPPRTAALRSDRASGARAARRAPTAETGLTCIDNTCVSDEFGLEKTDKVCVSVACAEPEDCLVQYTPEQCEALEAECTAETPVLTSCDLRAPLLHRQQLGVYERWSLCVHRVLYQPIWLLRLSLLDFGQRL